MVVVNMLMSLKICTRSPERNFWRRIRKRSTAFRCTSEYGCVLRSVEPGDTVLGMNLSHGGHLTHGSPVNFSGELYNFVEYGVSKEDEKIDYEDVRQKALEHKPKMIVAGASAYPSKSILRNSVKLRMKSEHIYSLTWRILQVLLQQENTRTRFHTHIL